MKLIKKYHVSNGKKYTNFYLVVNEVRIPIKPAFINGLDTLKAIAEEEEIIPTNLSNLELAEDKDENLCF